MPDTRSPSASLSPGDAGITALYVSATELMKRWFYRKDEGVICPWHSKGGVNRA